MIVGNLRHGTVIPLEIGAMTGFAIRLRHSPWANFEVDWRNPKNPLSPKWRKGIPAKVRVYQSTNFGYIYTTSMFIFS